MAGGAVLLFIGLALVAKYIVRPVAAAIGLPLERLSAVVGQLARENAQRNPARTALTAAALMVGLGLVVFVAVFTAGLKASIDGAINRLITAQIVVRADSGGFQPIPRRVQAIASRVPGVATTSGVLYDQVEVNGQTLEPPLRRPRRSRARAGSARATSSTGFTAPTPRCRGCTATTP